MLHMLDTNMASYIIKDDRRGRFLGKLEGLGQGGACVSAVTRAELLFGLKKVPGNARLQGGVVRFLRSVDVLPWESPGAEFYAEIRFELERAGRPIGEMDMLIAAHAIAVDAVLVTDNVRHFERIALPLMMVNWME